MKRTTLGPAMLVGAVLLVAGCGGSSKSGVAHLGSTASGSADPSGAGSSSPETENSASAQRKLVAYSQCMRTHGVPEFPEPSEGHLLLHSSNRNGHVTGVDPQSARFQAASKACAKLAPKEGKPPSAAEQAKMQEGALRFSRCMRTHGVPSFPDPQFSGGGRVSLRIWGRNGSPGAIDPDSPRFQAAQKACQSIVPGPKGGGPGNVAVAP